MQVWYGMKNGSIIIFKDGDKIKEVKYIYIASYVVVGKMLLRM